MAVSPCTLAQPQLSTRLEVDVSRLFTMLAQAFMPVAACVHCELVADMQAQHGR